MARGQRRIKIMTAERNPIDSTRRWRRREERRESERRRITQHGRSLGVVYAAAIRKRVKRLSGRPSK